MELLKQEQKEFVRIIIGSAETGKRGVSAPTKTLNVEGSTVQEVYEMIFDSIKEKEIESTKSKRR